MNGLLDPLLDGTDLVEEQACDLLHCISTGQVPDPVIAAILAALRMKGVSAAELRGFARALRTLATQPDLGDVSTAVDIVGTGGDGSGSLNLSTGSALLAAACGLHVVKHGNRSVSSRSGSADVLEALGFRVPQPEPELRELYRSTGFAFLFAPRYHSALAALAPVRRALGVRTVFNILGPLCNPVDPPFLVLGAYSEAVARVMAEALTGLVRGRAFVVHGAHGWDEATPAGRFVLYDVEPGRILRQVRDPASSGLARCPIDALRGGDASYNARAIVRAFSGEPGPHADALCLGAALALEVVGQVRDPAAALAQARSAIDDGRAARLLARISGGSV